MAARFNSSFKKWSLPAIDLIPFKTSCQWKIRVSAVVERILGDPLQFIAYWALTAVTKTELINPMPTCAKAMKDD